MGTPTTAFMHEFPSLPITSFIHQCSTNLPQSRIDSPSPQPFQKDYEWPPPHTHTHTPSPKTHTLSDWLILGTISLSHPQFIYICMSLSSCLPIHVIETRHHRCEIPLSSDTIFLSTSTHKDDKIGALRPAHDMKNKIIKYKWLNKHWNLTESQIFVDDKPVRAYKLVAEHFLNVYYFKGNRYYP